MQDRTQYLMTSFNRLHAVIARGERSVTIPADAGVDTKAVLALADEFMSCLPLIRPTLGNYRQYKPFFPGELMHPSMLQDMVGILLSAHEVVERTGVSDADNIYTTIIYDFTRLDLEPWERKVSVQMHFANHLDRYLHAISHNDKETANDCMDHMVALHCSCDETGDNDGTPEARFTREQQAMFNATAPQALALGLDMDDFELLSELGDDKGYLEGFGPEHDDD